MIIEKALSMHHALELLDSGMRPLAGGTNILVDCKTGKEAGYDYADISGITELKGIKEISGGVRIGALATFDEAEQFLEGMSEMRALYDSAYSMGGPQIRNRATVAGNICDASPACDAGPSLLVLEAVINTVSLFAKRSISADCFFEGVRKTALMPGELVTDIFVPGRSGLSFFRKAGPRKAMTVSAVSLAGRKKEDGCILLAMGSVAPTPVRLYRTEEYINGAGSVYADKLRQMTDADICPVDGRGATAEYRRQVAFNMVAAALEEVFGIELY